MASKKTLVAFISGHTNLRDAEFETHYRDALDKAIAEGHDFVIGTSVGGDRMGFDYLLKHGVAPLKITIYIYDKYKANLEPQYQKMGVKTKGGYTSYNQRDGQMTKDSDYDILWVRSEEENRKIYEDDYRAGRISGTEQNRIRRQKLAKKA